jgi:hypothetical protein
MTRHISRAVASIRDCTTQPTLMLSSPTAPPALGLPGDTIADTQWSKGYRDGGRDVEEVKDFIAEGSSKTIALLRFYILGICAGPLPIENCTSIHRECAHRFVLQNLEDHAGEAIKLNIANVLCTLLYNTSFHSKLRTSWP